MQNYFSGYFDTALQLIVAYDGTLPLNAYLKKYFVNFKKYGSNDRKQITHLCYGYCRLGFSAKDLLPKEKLPIALFLCNGKTGNWLSLYDEKWQAAYNEDLHNRIRFVQSESSFTPENIFFNNRWLSDGIDATDFNVSHLVQPLLFLRVRPNKTGAVIKQLQQHAIPFIQQEDNCIAMANATRIDEVIEVNKDAVVQDWSSQKVALFFPLITAHKSFSIWDCCAASGGKSLLAFDFFSDVKLTVSDVRSSILSNLATRFQQAGLHNYTSFIADVSNPHFVSKQQYDLVICDAPCSGSGTWSRTPEQLCFFTVEKLLYYTSLQKKITSNVVKAVKANGYLLYITCSVFMQENEEIVQHILQISRLKLVQANTINGFNIMADTMFAALFVNE